MIADGIWRFWFAVAWVALYAADADDGMALDDFLAFYDAVHGTGLGA